MEWVQPSNICDMLVISFKCFGYSIRGKTLLRIACLSLLWIVWRERNARIFEDIWKTLEMMCGISFIFMFLSGLTIQTFLNPILWV